MDEEDATRTEEREVEASVCETEKEEIDAQGFNCNVDDTNDGESYCDETRVDDNCKVICELVNPAATNGFGEAEIVNEIENEHMHARISHHGVDELYVDDMCGLFFETWIDCDNMVSTMFDETLKVEATTVVARYEAVGIAHEGVCHLARVYDQEHGKVIEEFFMRISTNIIRFEDNLYAVEKKADVEQEALTE